MSAYAIGGVQKHGSSFQQLTRYGLKTINVSQILVNKGSGNGLLPDGTKPLLEPVLNFYQWVLVAFTDGSFTVSLKISLTKVSLKIIQDSHIPQGITS